MSSCQLCAVVVRETSDFIILTVIRSGVTQGEGLDILPNKRHGNDKEANQVAKEGGKLAAVAPGKKECTCPICEEKIVDASEDSIKCEGQYDSWFHRKCVGLSTKACTVVMQSPTAFCCSHCRLEIQGK